jgi:hypothetical protein
VLIVVLLIALVCGVLGAVVKGLLRLLVIAAMVFVTGLALGAAKMRSTEQGEQASPRDRVSQ